MYLPFNHLPKFPKLANFEAFRQSLSFLFTSINRLTSGKTYVDLFSPQSVFTPIDIHGNCFVGKGLQYTSDFQIPTIPKELSIVGIDANYALALDSTHNYVKGMPLRYSQTGGTRLAALHENRVYWVKEDISGTSVTLSDIYGGDVLQVGTSSGTHTLSPAYPLTQIEETYYSQRNSSLPEATEGVLAYGDVFGTKSTLYYHDGGQFKPVKLGWGGGSGYYNNNGSDPQKNTGWCHGNGHYKIITASNQIKIQFDWIQVVENITGDKNIVSGLRTNPVSDYNVLVTNSGAGINSIDTGLITGDTGYYVFFVYNPSIDAYGVQLSLNADKPSFYIDPTTGTYFNSYQRLGWIKTDSAGNFLPSLQINDKFCFFEDPGSAYTISFLGGGTSVNFPLITGNVSSNENYPLPAFLNSTDLYIETNGTTVNNSNLRIISLSDIPQYQFTSTNLSNYSSGYLMNEYGVEGTSVNVSVAHPEDTGGTDYTSLNMKLMGFRFDKGELHV